MQAGSLTYVRLRWQDVVTGESKESVVPLPVTLGRANDNTLVLNSHKISRHHARLLADPAEGVVLQDDQSTNGTFVNQQRITRQPIHDDERFQIGPFHFTVAVVPAPPPETPRELDSADMSTIMLAPLVLANLPSALPEASLVFSRKTGMLLPFKQEQTVEKSLPLASFHQRIVPLREIYSRQLPVLETTYLTIGGGIGSFVWTDHLRIWGAQASQIIALGTEPVPTARFQRMARYSQIPGHERLRSNSDACPDNIWGWPSYGLREIWHALTHGKAMHALSIAGRVFGEPVLTDTYTPRADDVFQSVACEARRINWNQIWRHGWAQALRKTDDGRYIVAYAHTDSEPVESSPQFIITQYLHLAPGYPGIRFLSDLQEYREHTHDTRQAVNAYEEHDHVYEHLLLHGGVVMVRGRGIVASRVIQRLHEVRSQNRSLVILHVHRSPLAVGHRDGRVQRKVENHIELQPFNWPKACWGGPLRFQLEQADDQERDRLLNDWGGTTTSDRRDWRQIISTGLREGWYQTYFGEVQSIERNARGQLLTHLSTGRPNQPEISLTADFIIDCTGLEASLENNPLLKDLLETYQLALNPKNRLRLTNDFEVLGMDNGPGHVYASGAATLGGPLAVVDSFLGMQYAALRAVETLAALRAPGLRSLTPWRSFSQWTRWMRGMQP
ncbi:MAG TPA: FHA domain-containing protein [Ktedonobacteraceae bacterium]